jgi:hypothetical protein
MASVLLPTTTSPLSDYDSLKAAIALWLHRSDLTDVIPTFIALAEERINRQLRVRDMETELAETAISDGVIAVPSGVLAVKSLWLPDRENYELEYMPFGQLKALNATDTPTHYSRQGGYFYFNGTGTVQGILYEEVAALSDSNADNWLLLAHPSVYLRGAMVEAYIYLQDEKAMALHESAFQNALASVEGSDRRDAYSGPLTARAR